MAGPPESIDSATTTRPFYWVTSEPWLTFASNRAAWYTATQVAGKIFDAAGARYLDATPARRTLGLLTMAGVESFLGYFSHEFAHLQHYYNMGGQIQPQFEMTGPGGVLPKPVLGFYRWCPTSRCEYLRDITVITGGINQQEFNAQFLSGTIVHSEHLPPDLAMSYFLNRAFQPLYTAITMDNMDYVLDPPLYRLTVNWNKSDKNPIKDTPVILSAKEQLLWSLAAMLLSGRTLDSVLAAGGYLADGTRDYHPIHFDIKGTQIYPPDFQIFWHPDGLLLNVDLPLRHVWTKDDDLVVNVAAGVAGGLQVFRIGGAYGRILIASHPAVPTISIGQYFSINPDTMNPFGSLTQCTFHWLLPNGVGIDAEWQVSYQDPIETDIKGTGNEGQRIGIPLDLWRNGHAFYGGNNTLTLSGFIATTFMY